MTPGFGVRARDLRDGVRRLEALGFRVVLGPNALERDGYLAGSDEARASDLSSLIDAPGIRGIWFARGGGSTGPAWRARRRPSSATAT
jgi:muramoyltetrapeptide carboxypeptidase